MTLSRVAVVGSGAAAVSVLQALSQKPARWEVTLIDIGKNVPELPKGPVPVSPSHFYDQIYEKLYAGQPRQFPPPKTYLGEPVARFQTGLKGWKGYASETWGGLTNYWGGTMLPFTDLEMKNWLISRKQLDPYYRKVSDWVGISAAKDPLNDYLEEDFSTRPAIQPTQVLSRLAEMVNGGASNSGRHYRILAGLNRCALETRPEKKNHCIYCGECMAGCAQDSIYSARHTLKDLLERGTAQKIVKGKVTRVDPADKTVEIKNENGKESLGPFDKIFLSAGCPGTTEILMRSFGIFQGPVMQDNTVYSFPIVYFGKTPADAANEPSLALCNLLFLCVPPSADGKLAQAQVYHHFDYFIRYNISPKIWNWVKPFNNWLKSRVFWVRLYLHSDRAQAYHVKLENDGLSFGVERKDDQGYVEELMRDLRKVVNRNSFYIPPFEPVREKANSHYAGTFPYQGPILPMPASGEVASGIYVCDSTSFPDSPALSPTFTVMANALRIAEEALG